MLAGWKITSFGSINFWRKKIQIVEQKKEKPISTPNVPESTTPDIPDIPKEKESIKIEPCPGSKDQRVGDFRNEKRLERVIGHERGDDGIECITLYENVPFVDQYIPEPSTIVSTAVIGLVAASSPLILNIIKPAIKNIVKRLTKKKDKVE